jgi:hypothetical protein
METPLFRREAGIGSIRSHKLSADNAVNLETPFAETGVK